MVSGEINPHADPDRRPRLEIQDSDKPAATPDQHGLEARTSDQGSEDLTETPLRVEKLRSEIEKIALEKKQLERQLSRQSLALEWVKVAAVPASVLAALLTVGVTFYLGQRQFDIARTQISQQFQQAEEGRAADRFDKALGRLADQVNAGIRMTGISGLRLFLTDGSEQHQTEAAHYLVTAIAEEKSPEVQQAILDAFADARNFSQSSKDDALRTAIEVDRSLTEAAYERISSSRRSSAQKLSEKFNADPRSDPIVAFVQQMQISSVQAPPIFYDPTLPSFTKEDVITDAGGTLDHYVSLINLLIAAGARNVTNDWTKIYCQKCDFTTSRNLSGAHFDESYLSRANFAHIDLHGATFRSADLGGTIFFASDLSKADLSWTLFDDSGAKQNASRIRYSKFPILECATLNGADLSNTPLGEVTRRLYGREQQGLPAVELRMPRMISVKFDSNTKLTTLGMRFSFTADDAFFAALTPADQQALRSAFNTEPFDWPSTLIANFPFYANDVLPVDEIHITEFPPANRAPQVDGAPIRIDYIIRISGNFWTRVCLRFQAI